MYQPPRATHMLDVSVEPEFEVFNASGKLQHRVPSSIADVSSDAPDFEEFVGADSSYGFDGNSIGSKSD